MGQTEVYKFRDDLLVAPWKPNGKKTGNVYSVPCLANARFRFSWDESGPTLVGPDGFAYPVVIHNRLPWLSPEDSQRLDRTLNIDIHERSLEAIEASARKSIANKIEDKDSQSRMQRIRCGGGTRTRPGFSLQGFLWATASRF